MGTSLVRNDSRCEYALYDRVIAPVGRRRIDPEKVKS
jgi:hypothetical protein